MSEKNITCSTHDTWSFKAYLFHNRYNKTILWVALAGIVIQFLVFKYFYPYPDFLHEDSFTYLDIAQNNLGIASQ